MKELNPITRLTTRVLVFAFEGAVIPAPVLGLLKDTTFAAGTTCIEAESTSDSLRALSE